MDGTGARRHGAVVAVAVIVLVVIGGLFVGTFVLSVGETPVLVIQADAVVSPAPSNETGDPGSVTVTWTENADRPADGGFFSTEEPTHADYLTVSWAATNGSGSVQELDVGRAERNVTVSGGTWRLARTGHSVTLTERNATAATPVRILVTAHRNDAATVIVAKTVTL